MKKLISLMLITLICGGVFSGISGCGKDLIPIKEEIFDDIEYTAEKPILDFEWEKREDYYDLPNGDWYYTVKGYEFIEYKRYVFEPSEILKYYEQNLKGNSLYLLNYGYEKPVKGVCYLEDWYLIFKNKQTNELLFRGVQEIYDEQFGELSPDCNTGKIISVELDIYIKSIEKFNIDELNFEFGKRTIEERYVEKYINIYAGEECFATCYFNNWVYIPREWYENYIKTNLVWGDDLTYEKENYN